MCTQACLESAKESHTQLEGMLKHAAEQLASTKAEHASAQQALAVARQDGRDHQAAVAKQQAELEALGDQRVEREQVPPARPQPPTSQCGHSTYSVCAGGLMRVAMEQTLNAALSSLLMAKQNHVKLEAAATRTQAALNKQAQVSVI